MIGGRSYLAIEFLHPRRGLAAHWLRWLATGAHALDNRHLDASQEQNILNVGDPAKTDHRVDRLVEGLFSALSLLASPVFDSTSVVNERASKQPLEDSEASMGPRSNDLGKIP